MSWQSWVVLALYLVAAPLVGLGHPWLGAAIAGVSTLAHFLYVVPLERSRERALEAAIEKRRHEIMQEESEARRIRRDAED